MTMMMMASEEVVLLLMHLTERKMSMRGILLLGLGVIFSFRLPSDNLHKRRLLRNL